MTKLGIIKTHQLHEVLSRISYAPSCIDLNWNFEVEEVIHDTEYDYKFIGWHIRTTFRRPDTNTGELSVGHGRWEFIESGSSPDAVIKTCWLLLELIVRHELMEMFLVDGKRIFNPHKSIEDLKDK